MRPPASYLAFLISATVAYLVMVDVAKRHLVKRLGLGVDTPVERRHFRQR